MQSYRCECVTAAGSLTAQYTTACPRSSGKAVLCALWMTRGAVLCDACPPYDGVLLFTGYYNGVVRPKHNGVVTCMGHAWSGSISVFIMITKPRVIKNSKQLN